MVSKAVASKLFPVVSDHGNREAIKLYCVETIADRHRQLENATDWDSVARLQADIKLLRHIMELDVVCKTELNRNG